MDASSGAGSVPVNDAGGAAKRRKPEDSNGDSDAPVDVAAPPAKRRLDELQICLASFASTVALSDSLLTGQLISCGFTAAQAEHAVDALRRLSSAEKGVAEAAALSVAEFGRAPLAMALFDVGAVTAALAAQRTHASSPHIACCMASLLTAAVKAEVAIPRETVAAGIVGCLSALRHHAAERRLAVDAWAAISALLAQSGGSNVDSVGEIANAGVRTLQVLGSDAEVCSATCRALSSVVRANCEASAALRTGGAAELLLQLLEQHKASPRASASFCALLGEVRSSLPGIVKVVLEAMTRHKGDDEVAAACGDAIAQLATSPEFATQLLDSGAAEALVASLQRDGAAALSISACCDAVLALTWQGGTARLLAAGAASAIASAIREIEDLPAAVAGLSAVEQLRKNVEQSHPQWAAWRQSGLDLTITGLLGRLRNDLTLCRLCCGLISQLSVDAATVAPLTAKQMAHAALAAFARHSTDLDMQMSVCHTLRSASAAYFEDTAFLGTLVEAGGVALLSTVVENIVEPYDEITSELVFRSAGGALVFHGGSLTGARTAGLPSCYESRGAQPHGSDGRVGVQLHGAPVSGWPGDGEVLGSAARK